MTTSLRRRGFVGGGLAGAALAGLGGCVSLGGDAQPRQWYRLTDLGAAGRTQGEVIARSVLVEPVGSGALHDGNALVHGMRGGARAHYQFASWTQRPSQRLAQLLERRLVARGRFAAVGQTTTGIRGDLLLRVAVDEFMHDLTVPPGSARVVVLAELVDWRSRTLLARREFAEHAPAAAADAPAAADAFNRAVTRVLDALAPWAEDVAGAAP